MPKEIKCPKCKDGTLELLNHVERLKLLVRNLGDICPDNIYGCDECKYWIDAKEIENG